MDIYEKMKELGVELPAAPACWTCWLRWKKRWAICAA